LVIVTQRRVTAHRIERGHVQHLTDTRTATGDMSSAVPLATIVIIRSHADQGTNLLARELPELGQTGEQCAAVYFADRRHGLQQFALGLPLG